MPKSKVICEKKFACRQTDFLGKYMVLNDQMKFGKLYLINKKPAFFVKKLKIFAYGTFSNFFNINC